MFKRLYDVDDSLQKDLFLVKELVTFERFCRDQSLWTEMKKCFHPESAVCISWYKGSGQGFIEASEKMKSFAPHDSPLQWGQSRGGMHHQYTDAPEAAGAVV